MTSRFDPCEEAVEARNEALTRLETALSRGHEVHEIAQGLERRRQANHFAEQIIVAMRRR